VMKFEDPYDPEPTPRIEREHRLRLFQQLHQSPDEEEMVRYFMWRRANGHMKCKLCQLPYREHPLYDEYLTSDPWEDPTDHRLCNGDVIHP
jgi:hypothetical protein